MRHSIDILFVACVWCISANAQTPFDSFASETTRPMLELDGSRSKQPDSILCTIIADMQSQMLLYVNVLNSEVIASAPITDDIQKWLSVDPLSDKYPHISPYAYCSWNPINAVDPDGRQIRSGVPSMMMSNGIWTSAQNTVYLPLNVTYTTQKMSDAKYINMISQKSINTQGVIRPTFTKETYLQNFSDFEKGMMTNPVIQGVATGLLIGGTSLMVADAVSLATPAMLETGIQLQGLTLQGINVIEGSSALQFMGGMLEGGISSYLELPNNLPSAMESLPFKFGETTGQFLYEKGQELRNLIDLQPTLQNTIFNISE